MKIAIFCESYLAQTNSVETHVSILASGLKKLGHEVLVVTSDLETEECYEEQGVLLCLTPAARSKKQVLLPTWWRLFRPK